MNITVAAISAGVSRRTLYNWMDAGRLPYTVVNGSRQVQPADVDRLRRKPKDVTRDRA